MRIISTLFFLLLVLLGITFAGLNAEPVNINYYLGSTKLPLSLLLVITFMIGGLLSLFFNIVNYIRLKSANHSLRQRLKLAEVEIVNLRTLPLKDNH